MVSGKKTKHEKKIIILSVIMLTLMTFGISYSAFFSVQTQKNIQTITTGDLDVTIEFANSKNNGLQLYPTSDADLPQDVDDLDVELPTYSTLNIINQGSIASEFSITISYDVDHLPKGKTINDLVPLEYLNIGILDVLGSKWINFGTDSAPVYYTSISGLVPSGIDANAYPILRSSLNANGGTANFRVVVWLDADTPISQIGNLVYLKLDVKSIPVNGQMN